MKFYKNSNVTIERIMWDQRWPNYLYYMKQCWRKKFKEVYGLEFILWIYTVTQRFLQWDSNNLVTMLRTHRYIPF